MTWEPEQQVLRHSKQCSKFGRQPPSHSDFAAPQKGGRVATRNRWIWQTLEGSSGDNVLVDKERKPTRIGSRFDVENVGKMLPAIQFQVDRATQGLFMFIRKKAGLNTSSVSHPSKPRQDSHDEIPVSRVSRVPMVNSLCSFQAKKNNR